MSVEQLTEQLKANDEVASDGRGSWSAAKWLAVVVAVVGSGVALGAAGVAYATYDYSEKYRGRILPHARIAGVDVSGMTENQAIAAVRARIRPRLTRRIALSFRDRRWTVTPRQLGATSNLRRVVRAAVRASGNASFFDKMRMRMFDERMNFERSVAITYPTKKARSLVDRIASDLYLEPRDASIDYSSGWIEFTDDRAGRRVLVGKARSELIAALRRNRSHVPLPVKALEPEVTSEAYDQVLLVRIGENRLYLYDDGEIGYSWPIATGQPAYMTPTGVYEVTEKRYLPTWINPAPDTWGSDMPPEIPPGPSNPLGLRALNWSAPAIRFHGTEATYSLGYNASHGCVRLSNGDVIQLYDLVDVGTPIVSLVAGPLKPLYVSSPDPTPVADDGEGRTGDGGGDKGQAGDGGGDKGERSA